MHWLHLGLRAALLQWGSPLVQAFYREETRMALQKSQQFLSETGFVTSWWHKIWRYRHYLVNWLLFLSSGSLPECKASVSRCHLLSVTSLKFCECKLNWHEKKQNRLNRVKLKTEFSWDSRAKRVPVHTVKPCLNHQRSAHLAGPNQLWNVRRSFDVPQLGNVTFQSCHSLS